MAIKTIGYSSAVVTGQIVEAPHVSQSIEAFSAATQKDYDISISGSFKVTGSQFIEPDTLLTQIKPFILSYDETTGQIFKMNTASIEDGDGEQEVYRTGSSNNNIIPNKFGTYDNTGTNSAIASGNLNKINSNCSFIGGGTLNTASGACSFVGGGLNNIAGEGSVVVGGRQNSASLSYSFVGGGQLNTSSGNHSFIGGGCSNLVSSSFGTIAGGFNNKVFGYLGIEGCGNSILGGSTHIICAATASLRANNAIVGGASSNIFKFVHDSIIGGGTFNKICGEGLGATGTCTKATKNNAIIGGFSNLICDKEGSSERNTIIGGSSNSMIFCISTGCCWELSKQNSIIGGRSNSLVSGTCFLQNSSINGGVTNKICGFGNSFIGGGVSNIISGSSAAYGSQPTAAIVGGYLNKIEGSFNHNFIGGGQGNRITGSNTNIGIVGGYFNRVTISDSSQILGGCQNTICTSNFSSIIGGKSNTIAASHNCSAIIAASSKISTAANTLFTCNICAFGSLTKASGTFLIDHPDPSLEPTHNLVHSFVESPTAGDNIYRFSVTTVNNEAEIILPEYYRYLNKDSQLWVSANGHFGKAFGLINISVTKIKVTSNEDGKYNIMLVGTRKDKAASAAWKGVVREKTKEQKINYKNNL